MTDRPDLDLDAAELVVETYEQLLGDLQHLSDRVEQLGRYLFPAGQTCGHPAPVSVLGADPDRCHLEYGHTGAHRWHGWPRSVR